MTKVTAAPIRVAVASLPETPRNGQMPRKYARTKLFVRDALTKIAQSWLLSVSESIGVMDAPPHLRSRISLPSAV